MTKIILGVMGLFIVGAGAYYLLQGSGPGDGERSAAQTNAAAAVGTPVNIPTNTAQTNPAQADQAAATSPTAPAQTAATNQPQPTTNTPPMQNITQATLHTSMGDIVIEFYPKQAPNTVANFIKLASSGFYDGTKFHRVIKDFMDQGGDPLTKDDTQQARWGTGGPGYQIPDEISATNSNVVGSVAMANSGPNTNGSQFFINAKDNHFLDPNYTVFGHVVSGLDVALAINKVATNSGDRPLTPIVIKSVSVK